MITALVSLFGICLGNELAVSYGAFWVVDTQNFIEFYYSLPYSSLSHQEKGDTFFASFRLLFYLDGSLRDSLRKTVRLKKNYRTSSLSILDGFGIFQRAHPLPSLYQLDIMTESSLFSVTDTLKSFDFQASPSLSSIIFATYVGTDSLVGRFYRNGYYFNPAPARRFGESAKIAYVYLEVYNLTTDTTRYEVTYSILKEGKERQLAHFTERANKRNFVLTFGFSTAGLKEGKHTLLVTIKDCSSGKQAQRAGDFYVYHQKPSSPQSLIKVQEGEMLFELENAFIILAQEREKTDYKNLTTDEDKLSYLKRYFAKTDYREIKSRLAWIDKNLGKKRHFSDRARIIMKYGIPSEIEVHSFKEQVRYHEHWYYLDKNYHFLFMTIHGEEPILLWSNVVTERNYPGWEKYIDPDEYNLFRH